MYPSDEELIVRVKNRDTAAFTQIFDKYSGKIYGYLFRYLGDYHMAQDITVRTFMKVYKKIDLYTEKGLFLAWVYRIATNLANTAIKRNKKRREVSIDQPLDDADNSLAEMIADEKARPDYKIISDDSKAFFYKVISKMKPGYKQVLMLCDIEGLSYEKIAKILKMNVKTVGTRVRRARKLLYRILKENGYEF